MSKQIHWPAVALTGVFLAGGILLAIFGGEYASHAEGLIMLAIGQAALPTVRR